MNDCSDATLLTAARERRPRDQLDRDAVLRGDVDARTGGINGVPFFIFNRRIGVSGAQAPETLLNAMADATKA